jgi:hypothetical protein
MGPFMAFLIFALLFGALRPGPWFGDYPTIVIPNLRASFLISHSPALFMVLIGSHGSQRRNSLFLPDPLATYRHTIEYYFVNIADDNDTANHFITPGPSWDEIASRGPTGAHHWPSDVVSRTLTAVSWFSYRYYLSKSSARWFLRTCEDVMINWTNLDCFITEADQVGDPLTQKLAFGSCVGSDEVYPQGGSGYFFSRRFVSEAASDEKFVQFTEELYLPEDVAMGRFLAKQGITMHSATTDRLLGHEGPREPMGNLIRGEYDRLPECPPEPDQRNKCRHFFARTNALAIIHAGWGMPDMNERREYAKGMWRAPSYVFWYLAENTPQLCRSSSR